MKLLGRYIHGSHRRNDAPRGQRSQRLGGGAQVRCCWQCRVSIMVLIQIRSSPRPRPPTRLRRRNYTCPYPPGDNSGDFRDEAGDAAGICQRCCGRGSTARHTPGQPVGQEQPVRAPDAVDEEVGRSDPHERFPGAPSEPRPKQEILTRDSTPTEANASSIYRDSTCPVSSFVAQFRV